MNINRHNYEELFLLYVDNELTVAQRMIVEAFVTSNPDLKEEFNLIQQSTFRSNETLDNGFKTSLLKPVSNEAVISEEQLLLYVDDELSRNEKDTVEKVLAVNESLQNELQWLQQSKLQADETIFFPDKSILYKEAQPARIFFINQVSIRWTAAAAILFLLGSGIWFLINQPKNQNGPLVNKPSVIEENKNPLIQNNPKTSEVNQQQIVQKKAEPVQPVVTVEEKNNSKVKLIKQNAIIAKSNPVNNQNVKQPTQQETLIAKNETQANTQTQNNSTQGSNISTTPTVPQETSTANTYSYASYNNDESNDEETTLLNEDRQRRSGLKGWVKKAKRMIERKTGMQSTDSEVRFAVFAINTQ
jgi:hypothetical protein